MYQRSWVNPSLDTPERVKAHADIHMLTSWTRLNHLGMNTDEYGGPTMYYRLGFEDGAEFILTPKEFDELKDYEFLVPAGTVELLN